MNLKFADLHLHSTLRPFAEYCIKPSSEKASIWYQEKAPKNPIGRAKNYTQSDFTSLYNGNIKLAFTAMYPIEQGWFDVFEALGITDEDGLNDVLNYFMSKGKIKSDFMLTEVKNVLKNRDDKNKIIDEIIGIIGHWLTSLPVKRITQIISDDYNYFVALKEELDFLESQCNKDLRTKIPKNKTELLNYLNDNSTMIIIPSIEGASSYVNGNAKTIKNGEVDFKNIHNNIQHIKDNYSVFFQTLSHHFYNGFNGHAQSIYGVGRVGIDQMFGKGNVITQAGFEIVNHLLSIGNYKNSGNRILIDTKHLSIAARIDYYKFIENYNAQNPDDKIPIISSHSAFSGVDNIENIGIDDNFFSDYEVNIATEEVLAIYNSNGLIGLNFDQNVLSQKPKIANKDKDKNKNTKYWTPDQWAELFTDNLLGMVQFAKKIDKNLKKEIWDIFTIGSDFDGFIDPTNAFPTAVYLPELNFVLIENLGKNKLFNELSFGLSAEEIVNKFMGKNAIEFIKRNYWENNFTNHV